MRSTILRLLLLLVICTSAALSQDRSGIAASNTTGNLIYISHVTVVDAEASKDTHDQTVIISDNPISDVQDSKGANPPANAKIVDARGKFLIPGLWHACACGVRGTYRQHVSHVRCQWRARPHRDLMPA